jgi:hypothetical protein
MYKYLSYIKYPLTFFKNLVKTCLNIMQSADILVRS